MIASGCLPAAPSGAPVRQQQRLPRRPHMWRHKHTSVQTKGAFLLLSYATPSPTLLPPPYPSPLAHHDAASTHPRSGDRRPCRGCCGLRPATRLPLPCSRSSCARSPGTQRRERGLQRSIGRRQPGSLRLWRGPRLYTIARGSVTGTTRPALYTTQCYVLRGGAFTYTLPLPAGAYTVTEQRCGQAPLPAASVYLTWLWEG